MPFGAADMMEYIQLFRGACFTGRYGSGKSALCVLYARFLSQMGYDVVSNIPLALPGMVLATESEFCPVERLEHKKCVVLLDEAWTVLPQGSSNRELRGWFAYLRKRDLILLASSVLPVVRFPMTIQRLWSAGFLGFPFWLCGFWLSGYKERHLHVELVSSVLFTWYNTLAEPEERWRFYVHAT